MKFINNWIIGNDKNLEKRNVIWNIGGSFLFAFASMLLTVVAKRVTGEEVGGIFAFGLSVVGQQMLNVSYLGIRPSHVTDTRKRYTFGEYFILRIFGCLFALLCGLGFVIMKGYHFVDFMVVLLMVLYKVIDGFADVYECEFQRRDKLYLTGKSNAFRTVISMLIFVAVLLITQDIVISCIAINVAAIGGVLLFNVGVLKQLSDIRFQIDFKHCKVLLLSSVSLFIGGFMELYIFSASRYAVENSLSREQLMSYVAIFMPTSVINLAATFIVRPYLTELSGKWGQKEFKDFKNRILKICFIIFGLGLFAVAAAYFLGIPVLGMIYDEILMPYRIGLIFIIIGGAFNAMTTMLYYALVIMERKNLIFIAYAIGFVLALGICTPLISIYGLNGAGFAHMILMCLLTLIFAVFTVAAYKKEERIWRKR